MPQWPIGKQGMDISVFYSLVREQRPPTPEEVAELEVLGDEYPFFHAVQMLRAVARYTQVVEGGGDISAVREITGTLPRPVAVIDYVNGIRYSSLCEPIAESNHCAEPLAVDSYEYPTESVAPPEEYAREDSPLGERQGDDAKAPLEPTTKGEAVDLVAQLEPVDDLEVVNVDTPISEPLSEPSQQPSSPLIFDFEPLPGFTEMEQPIAEVDVKVATSTDISDVLGLSLAVPIRDFTPTGFGLDPEDVAALSDKNWVKVHEELSEQYRAPRQAPRSQAEIFDSFIEHYKELHAQAEAEAARLEAAHVEAEDLNAASAVVGAQIASERLADFHAQNGNNEQAIAMYRVLIEKNPEKRVYFAAKIEKLASAETDA